MATLPQANLTIVDEAIAPASGTDLVAVFMVAAQDADTVPRLFASLPGLLSKHGYSKGVDYCAMHFQKTRKPVLVVPLPAATAGTIYQLDMSGVSGSSAVTVTADTNGVQDETHGVVTVTSGGTIGTDSIKFDLSLDGGRTTKNVRLGTASSYTVPYLGIVLNFAAGTLVAGDTFTFRTTAPRWDSAGLAAGRAALAAQQKAHRSWLVVGDLLVEQDATDVLTQVNAYETENERDVYARTQARDRYADALMVGSGVTLTFAENSPAADTITRSAGSFITDGFKAGMKITVAGSGANDGTYTIASLTATIITLKSTDDLVAAAAVASVTLTGEELAADWRSSIDAEFDDIDDEKRIDIAAGYGRERSPITDWLFRRPCSWAASLREYQHDVHIPVWRKEDRSLGGFSLEDANGITVEHDERIDGGLLVARFTCFRTWANGPNGTYIALSLTRALEGSLLSRTHNIAVVDVACQVTRAETEMVIGQVLVLNDDGTASEASVQVIEERVNSALSIALLQDKGEGQRASGATWTASRDDVLNIPDATLNGQLELLLNGTIEKINTRARVQTAG